MPTHVYRPRRTPATWFDRLMVHPMDTTVAVVSLLFALLLSASAAVPGFYASDSARQMSPYTMTSLAVAFAVGGVLILMGLNWNGEEVSKGWALERFGWLLASGGFIGYSLSVATAHPSSLFAWGVPGALAIGALLRCWSVLLIERSTRQTLKEVRGEMDGT